MKSPVVLFALITLPAWSQVLDVNGDSEVGPEEAIAVAGQWKGTAIRANDHNHLGQTWVGNRNPLTIRGSFPVAIIPGPVKDGEKGEAPPRAAPLFLDNEALNEFDNATFPDLILDGDHGVLAAQGTNRSPLSLRSNGSIFLSLDVDGESEFGASFSISGVPPPPFVVAFITDTGDMTLQGNLTADNFMGKIDHPLDPANKFLVHSSVKSPEMKNVYDGVVILDDRGESSVSLPPYFEALNANFRYTLTPIGAAAPNLHVAEEIQDNQFKIAGGLPGMKISWQVTGVRQDPYAKAHPVAVEEAKTGEDKGRFLHPEIYGEPVSKSYLRVVEE